MPDETPSSPAEATAPVETSDPKPEVKFTLEKIDAENVKKTDPRMDVTVLNIPALQKEKADIEAMMAKFKTQLDQINEVLDEFKNLP